MRTLLFCLAIGLLPAPPAAADASDEAIRKELQELNGTWLIRSMTIGGKELQEAASGQSWVIKDGTMMDGKGGEMAAVLKIDPARTPKCIDILFTAGPSKGTAMIGVYKREGEFLSIGYATEGKERPKELTTPPAAGTNLAVFQRQKGTPPAAAPKAAIDKTIAPSAAARTNWEYKTLSGGEVLELGKSNLNNGLNRLGDEGWELVAVEADPEHARGGARHVGNTYYFKRPKAAVAAAPQAKPAPRGELKIDEFQVIMLKHVDAVTTAKTLQQLFMDQKDLRFVPDPNTNVLLIRAPAEHFELIRNLVRVLDSDNARDERRKVP
jgi:uncharacterized protein (TIGR03067 family)